jgi:hypothetical protein
MNRKSIHYYFVFFVKYKIINIFILININQKKIFLAICEPSVIREYLNKRLNAIDSLKDTLLYKPDYKS